MHTQVGMSWQLAGPHAREEVLRAGEAPPPRSLPPPSQAELANTGPRQRQPPCSHHSPSLGRLLCREVQARLIQSSFLLRQPVSVKVSETHTLPQARPQTAGLCSQRAQPAALQGSGAKEPRV